MNEQVSLTPAELQRAKLQGNIEKEAEEKNKWEKDRVESSWGYLTGPMTKIVRRFASHEDYFHKAGATPLPLRLLKIASRLYGAVMEPNASNVQIYRDENGKEVKGVPFELESKK